MKKDCVQLSNILNGDVKKEMFRLTLPSVGGMLAIMIFNVTDTFFVSKLGTDQLAAMGFTFSVVMMVGALTMGFSTGATSIVSRAIGSGDFPKARRTVTDGLFLTVLVALIVSIIGFFNITPIFTLLGASGKVLFHIKKYMTVWFAGVIVAVMPPLSDDCLRASGDTVRPFYVMTICGLLNLILDPILIFGWGPFPAMGIQGAAIATIIARFFGMSASLYFLHFRARLIEMSLPNIQELIESWKLIIYLGIPAALTKILVPFSQAFYIKMAVFSGGVSAVAALAAGTRIEIFIAIFAMAYEIAIIPFVGQNYGAGKHNRVDVVRSMNVSLAMIYSSIAFLVLFFAADGLSSIFSDVPEVKTMCAMYLSICCIGHVGLYLCNTTSRC